MLQTNKILHTYVSFCICVWLYTERRVRTCWRWRGWPQLACCQAVCCPGASKLCRAVSIQAYTGSLGTFLNLSLSFPPVSPSVSLYPLTDSRLWGALLSILHALWVAPKPGPQWVGFPAVGKLGWGECLWVCARLRRTARRPGTRVCAWGVEWLCAP